MLPRTPPPGSCCWAACASACRWWPPPLTIEDAAAPALLLPHAAARPLRAPGAAGSCACKGRAAAVPKHPQPAADSASSAPCRPQAPAAAALFWRDSHADAASAGGRPCSCEGLNEWRRTVRPAPAPRAARPSRRPRHASGSAALGCGKGGVLREPLARLARELSPSAPHMPLRSPPTSVPPPGVRLRRLGGGSTRLGHGASAQAPSPEAAAPPSRPRLRRAAAAAAPAAPEPLTLLRGEQLGLPPAAPPPHFAGHVSMGSTARGLDVSGAAAASAPPAGGGDTRELRRTGRPAPPSDRMLHRLVRCQGAAERAAAAVEAVEVLSPPHIVIVALGLAGLGRRTADRWTAADRAVCSSTPFNCGIRTPVCSRYIR